MTYKGAARTTRRSATKSVVTGENLEWIEQRAFYKWVCLQRGIDARLWAFTSIPNEIECTAMVGDKLKSMGKQKGYPDTFLACAAGEHDEHMDCERHGFTYPYFGLYIEFKRESKRKAKQGGLTDEQIVWANRIVDNGYAYCVAYNWEEAKDYTEQYLADEWCQLEIVIPEIVPVVPRGSKSKLLPKS